jgi:hypothetical protein
MENIDAYENLILLCRKHHKQVDDQVTYYTVERLQAIKRAHEEWAADYGKPNARRGNLQSYEPHTFAAAITPQLVRIRLPLVIYNTGTEPIVIQNLRLQTKTNVSNCPSLFLIASSRSELYLDFIPDLSNVSGA